MKTINILGKTIDIRITSDLDSMGLYRPNESLILINKNMSSQQKVSTFLHEILEAICSECDLQLPHQTLQTLETSLYQVLITNKLLKDIKL